jgi:hypothetical protein
VEVNAAFPVVHDEILLKVYGHGKKKATKTFGSCAEYKSLRGLDRAIRGDTGETTALG